MLQLCNCKGGKGWGSVDVKEYQLVVLEGTDSAVPEAVAIVAGEEVGVVQQPPLLQLCNCQGEGDGALMQAKEDYLAAMQGADSAVP